MKNRVMAIGVSTFLLAACGSAWAQTVVTNTPPGKLCGMGTWRRDYRWREVTPIHLC